MKCVNCPAFSKSIFQQLSDQELESLHCAKEILNLEKDESIFLNGQSADHVFCLMDIGSKIFQKNSSENSERLIRIIGPGELCGIRSIFHRNDFLGSAKTTHSGHVCKIEKRFFLKLMLGNSELAIHLLRKLSKEISRAENHIQNIATKNVSQRLVEVLEELSIELGEKLNEDQIRIPYEFSRKELASLIPASMENITRIISDFKKEGLIEEINNEIIINLKKLRSFK